MSTGRSTRGVRWAALLLAGVGLLATGWWVGSRPREHQAGAIANVGNFVWNDVDGDGVQDAGEPGVAGVTVQAWNDTKTMLLASAVTNGSGNYTLQVTAGGTYTVRVVLPAGRTATLKDQGGNDQTDSDIDATGFTSPFVIASNVISTTIYDAGLTVGDGYWPVGPARLLDTRSGALDGLNQVGKRAAGTTLQLQVTGRAGVPTSARVVTLNLTALQGEVQGFVTAYPCGAGQPGTSSLNYGPGQPPIANEVQVAVGEGGKVCLFTSTNVHLLADVSGVTIG